MSVPNKTLVCLFVEGKLRIVGLRLKVLVSPLQGVSQVVAVGVVESWSVQDSAKHGQEDLVLSVLSVR